MPMPYCCHLISSIELTYSSDTRIPKPVLRAFKYPRLDSYNEDYGPNSKDAIGALEPSEDDIEVCNRILGEHGYCLVQEGPLSATQDAPLRIKRLYGHGSRTTKRGRERRLNGRSQFQEIAHDGSGVGGKNILNQVVDIIKRSMVYYTCLFDDYTQDFEHVTSKAGHGSTEACRIRKNSAYELLCTLKDCLFQLRHNGKENMEAVLITEEYSGIFTHEEVLITRSTMAFRKILEEEGIQCYRIYDHIASSNKMHGDEDAAINEDELMNEYLKVPLPRKPQESNKSIGTDLAIVKDANRYSECDRWRASKADFFRSLNIPIPDDDDMSLFSVKGHSACSKLLKLLEEQCKSNLLKMKKANGKLTPVKFVLTNFPVIFAKVQEIRVSSHEAKVENTEELNSVTINGLILPSVLNNIFKAVRRMQACSLVKDVSVNVSYNTEIDAELHDPSLQISERNSLYNNFMANMNSLERGNQPIYRVLRKMVPFKNFIVHKGRVAVSSKGVLKIRSALALSKRRKDVELGGRVMCLTDMPRGHKYLRDASQSSDSAGGEDLVILKDTLYSNLSSIMFTTMHLEGASSIATMPTKALVDDSLSNVYWVETSSAPMHPYALRCYLNLYPVLDMNESKTIFEVVQPYHLVNLVWMMNYLLHAGGFVPFVDRESFMDSTSEQLPEQDNIYSFLYLSQSHVDDISRMSEADLSLLFNADVSTTRDDPLAQQSYVLMLVHHIRFNKRFQSLFGRSYAEYSREHLQNMRDKGTKRMGHTDAIQSETNGDMGLSVLRLTNSWHSLLQRVQSEASVADTAEPSPIEATKEDTADDVGPISSQNDDVINYDLSVQKVNEDINNIPNGFLNMFQAITSGNDTNLEKSKVDSFHSVSSAARAHGRVHHCVFDFDAKVPFKDKNDRSKFQHDIAKMYNTNTKKTSRPMGKRHVVFVFLTSKVITSLECSRVKLIKDMVNSSNITFIPEENTDNGYDIERNALNAESFTRKFKSECVAASFGDYYVKAGVSYSFVTNADRLDRHLVRLLQMFGDNVMYDLYYIGLEMDLQSTSSTLDQVVSTVSGVEARHTDKILKKSFVNYSWLCDSYFNGAIDLQAEIADMHTLPIGETVKGTPRKNSTRQCKKRHSDADHLGFNPIYRAVKFLWGWNVYVLAGDDASSISDDALLYRKHCGIHISYHDSLDSITDELVRGIKMHLERFKLTEEDVNTCMSYPRIYTNTVVLVGDVASKAYQKERISKELANCAGFLRSTFGDKAICFGRYDGIPILKTDWLIDTLSNARPEPLCEYIMSSWE